MIPPTGHKIEAIDPDSQDDLFERQHTQALADSFNSVAADSPFLVPLEDFEKDKSLSVRHRFTNKDITSYYG